MKIHNGFISNSSSCSFILWKKDLTKFQKCAIRHHIEFGRLLGIEYCDNYNEWEMKGIKNKWCPIIQLSTSMTNFDMKGFLRKIGVSDDMIHEESE